jgi:hypothetical protein
MAAAVIDVVDYYADHAQPHWKIAIVNKIRLSFAIFLEHRLY